jgi:hypothetical protein
MRSTSKVFKRLFAGVILLCAIHARPGFAQGPIVGYAVVNADGGRNVPSGNLVFGFVQDSVLVSETAVPSSPPVRSALLFAEINLPAVNCGVAIANPNGQTATVSLRLGDSNNTFVASGNLAPIPANGQTAKMLTEIFPAVVFPSVFRGVLSITSDIPVSIITLRLSTNSRGDTVMATLPVVNTAQTLSTEPRVLPQIAAGGGYTTQVILLNPTSSQLYGNIQFYGSAGQPLNVGAQHGSYSQYSVPPGGLYFGEYRGSPGAISVGSAIVRPDPGSVAPVATAIFSYRSKNVLVTEAAVSSPPALRRARIYVDVTTYRNTGVAIAAPGEAVTATLTLRNADGSISGLPAATLNVPANGQTARYVTQLFPSMPNPFRGVLEVASSTTFSAIALRQTVNSRSDVLLTTFPVASPELPAQQSMTFPHFVTGGGYQTEIILIGNGEATSSQSLSAPPDKFAASTGVIIFRLPNGEAMPVWVDGFFGTSAPFNVDNNGALSQLPNADAPNVVLLTTGLPDARVLAPYQIALIASGGTRPYNFALLDGELPNGLRLDANGMITGVPAPLGGGMTRRISTFHVRVTDDRGLIVDSGLLSITTNLGEIVFPLPAALPDAIKGVPYTFALPQPTGGVPPYHYQLNTAGGFPPFGITINPTGSLSGTPTQVETRTFAICAVDLVGQNVCPTTTLRVIERGFTLTVSKAGTGSGMVTGGGISCGTACSASFASGASVTLTATPATGSTFTGWSGACGGIGLCVVTMNTNQSVTASFNSTGGSSGVAGTWTGTWTRQPSGFCDVFTNNITWRLVQNGNAVTGTFDHIVTVASGDFCPDVPGTRTTGQLVGGTISGNTLNIFTEGGWRFVGTFTSTTISGTTPGSGIGTGSFTLGKQ